MTEVQPSGVVKILQAAEACFAEKGFEGTSLQEIAHRAGVSKANLFHHFGSKERLYLAVLRHACKRFTAALDIALEADPLKRMETFVCAHLQALLDHPQAARLIQRALLESGEARGRQLAEGVFAEAFARVVELVHSARNKGALRADIDPALVAFLLIGAGILFFETRSVLRHLPGVTFAEDAEAYSRHVFRLLLEGVVA